MTRGAIEEHRERVFTLFPRLEERRSPTRRHALRRRAADAGHRARADGRPRLLLLDEPSLGLAPAAGQGDLRHGPRDQRARRDDPAGRAERARGAARLAHQGYVLETGQIVLSGPAGELLRDERVRKAYLGEQEEVRQ